MSSCGIALKTGRISAATFTLLGLIWTLSYVNPFATIPQFLRPPLLPGGDASVYPKIEDLTTASKDHEHSRSSKAWFFGASSDDVVVVKESEEWFRLSASQLSATGSNSNSKSIAIATETAKLKYYGDSDKNSIEEYIAPVNISTQTISNSNIVPTNGISNMSATSLVSLSSSTHDTPKSTPVILYAFSPAPWALPNIRFFLKHALHGSATFVFILNGALVPDGNSSTLVDSTEADIFEVIAILQPFTERYTNVKIWKRPNTCFDLGAYAEVLKTNSSALVKAHDKFVLINASLRGPFVPFWSNECWSDAYLRLLNTTNGSNETKVVKLVGMTINCVDVRPRHIQSMILATDRIGMHIILGNGEVGTATDATWPEANIGINSCPASMDEAVDIEVSLTPLIQSYNYTVRAMMVEYWSKRDYELDCTNGDVTASKGAYEGGDLGVFETLFIKTRWGVEADQINRLTKWYDEAIDSGMSNGAWDKCS